MMDQVGSPIRPFRQPRFSTACSDSPNENCPAHMANGPESPPVYPRQFLSSPGKFSERNVLLLMGSKVPSSVPGRRSSIACHRDRKLNAPMIVFEDSPSETGVVEPAFVDPSKSMQRSKSMKALSNSNGLSSSHGLRTLKRL